MDDPVVILRAGVVTPIGLSLAETAASARARVARVREIGWHDRRLQPFLAGSVPDAGLPSLVQALQRPGMSAREMRLLRLAHAALDDTLSAAGPAAVMPLGRLPLLLALPEHHTTSPIESQRFLDHLDVQCPGMIDVADSLAVPNGRAGGLMALRAAGQRLVRGDCEHLLVGGVDSLIDPYVLGTLDLQGRVRSEVNSDGMRPSEGAAFLHLCLHSTAVELRQMPLVVLQGQAHGHEPGHLYADEPYLGEGLAATFEALFEQAGTDEPVQTVYSSFNGEHHWAREFGVARLRQTAAFTSDHAMEHPAECFGDMGAAHGVALTALASHAVRHGYRRDPCLVYASSDHGERAAALLRRAA